MNRPDPPQLSDDELLEEFRRIKPSPMTDAFLIGFLVGIIVFGVVASAWTFFALIPLYLIYVFLKKSDRYDALKEELERRNLH
jgi:hypothetical protein